MRSLRLSSLLAALSLSTLAGSFVIQWYVLTALGASAQTDALFAAMTIPLLLFDVLSGALGYVLVPMFSAASPDQGRKHAWSLAQVLGGVVFGASGVLGAVAGVWVPLLAPGFGPQGLALTLSLTRTLLFFPGFAAGAAVACAYLQSQGRLIRAELNYFAAMCVSAAFLFWALPRMGLPAAAWTMVVRSGIELVLHLGTMGGYGGVRRGDPFLTEFIRRARHVVVSGAIFKTDQLVDRLFASYAPTGQLSLLYLSRQIQHALARVLGRALVVPVVPELGRAFHCSDDARFIKVLGSRTRVLLVVCVLVFLGLLLFGSPVLSFVFERRNLGRGETDFLFRVTLLLSGLMIGDALWQLVSAAFYARGDTHTPAKLGVGAYVAGIGLKALGFWSAGVLGLALGLSAYYLLGVVALVLANRRWERRRLADHQPASRKTRGDRAVARGSE